MMRPLSLSPVPSHGEGHSHPSPTRDASNDTRGGSGRDKDGRHGAGPTRSGQYEANPWTRFGLVMSDEQFHQSSKCFITVGGVWRRGKVYLFERHLAFQHISPSLTTILGVVCLDPSSPCASDHEQCSVVVPCTAPSTRVSVSGTDGFMAALKVHVADDHTAMLDLEMHFYAKRVRDGLLGVLRGLVEQYATHPATLALPSSPSSPLRPHSPTPFTLHHPSQPALAPGPGPALTLPPQAHLSTLATPIPTRAPPTPTPAAIARNLPLPTISIVRPSTATVVSPLLDPPSPTSSLSSTNASSNASVDPSHSQAHAHAHAHDPPSPTHSTASISISAPPSPSPSASATAPLSPLSPTDTAARPVRHITIFTIGSRGDVQPFIAWGKHLASAPHNYTVRIATFTEFRSFVLSHGLEFAPVAGDPVLIMAFATEKGMFTPRFLAEGQFVLRPWIDDMMLTAYQACKGTDLIIGTPSALCGVHVAEAYHVPYISAMTMPWHATRAFAHPFFVPNAAMGGGWNLLTHKLTSDGMALGMYMQINKFRKRIGLDPTTLFGPIWAGEIPTIYCYSPSVLPSPPDWPATAHVPGYFFLDNPDVGYEPPAALTSFLTKHRGTRPIVYIGTGSIVIDDAVAFSRVVAETARKCDAAFVVAEGWSGRGKPGAGGAHAAGAAVEWPENVIKIGAVPHDYLFAQVDAVVHHGGAGTVAAGLRAGKPTAVHPFFGDQHFWGDILERAKVGVRIKKTTVDEFVSAITQITTWSEMRANALRIAAQIAQEDGVRAATDIIEREIELARAQMDAVVKRAAAKKAATSSIRRSFEGLANSLPRPPSPSHVLEVVKMPYEWIAKRRGSVQSNEDDESRRRSASPARSHASSAGEPPSPRVSADITVVAATATKSAPAKKENSMTRLLRSLSRRRSRSNSEEHLTNPPVPPAVDPPTAPGSADGRRSGDRPSYEAISPTRPRKFWNKWLSDSNLRQVHPETPQLAQETMAPQKKESRYYFPFRSHTVDADNLSAVVDFSEEDDYLSDEEGVPHVAHEQFQQLYARVRKMTMEGHALEAL
ncbi:glycosyltransferase family 1 protein [Gonapodya prolifera JEL478]|uniref:Glycosyltransferase family 1 protein n=1 Tax=Gonapodya prolifera (strain JEL478) TaxID=1344416 RepID=A0A139A661_GONPJ|nr:glycosyltransferase family 1 protein [Gonapodya prolifera JEL478]|eukprot:KXS12214.1 glycosyltransferase family 1 protein [Gonapodya prolifera JEL478]